jgi:hypothetical protein
VLNWRKNNPQNPKSGMAIEQESLQKEKGPEHNTNNIRNGTGKGNRIKTNARIQCLSNLCSSPPPSLDLLRDIGSSDMRRMILLCLGRVFVSCLEARLHRVLGN